MGEEEKEIICEFCGLYSATLLNHFEEHLAVPRKVNICDHCHSRIHFVLTESRRYARLKIPRSALPLFQSIYPKIVSLKGEVIFDGEEFFKVRYEVVEDSEWVDMNPLDRFPELKKIAMM